jgi:hypothetical protein
MSIVGKFKESLATLDCTNPSEDTDWDTDNHTDYETATVGWGPQEDVNKAKIINESIQAVLNARLGKNAPKLSKSCSPSQL